MKHKQGAYFLPIRVVRGGQVPLHRQVYAWFRSAILCGQLHPGQSVPSTRGLAVDLGISRAPVLIAYEELEAEGYLETRGGSGTRVATALGEADVELRHRAGRPPSAPEGTSRRRVAPRAANMIADAIPAWLRNDGAFRIGLPDTDGFPLAVWSSLLARYARDPLPNRMGTMNSDRSMGYPPLREAVAEYLRTMRAVRCGPAQVMIVNGTQNGLQISARVLLDDGDAVWLEEPGYFGAHAAFACTSARIVAVPVDKDGLDVREGTRRERGARAAYVTPSHQFPLGSTMSLVRRMQILEWAARSGAWIFEDDYDSDYRFTGQPLASLQGLDAGDRVVYFGTFSKVLFPGLRLGYIVIPVDLVPAFRSTRTAMDGYSPLLYQMALAQFIRDGYFARHIRRMRSLYAARRRALIEAIHDYLGDEFHAVGAEAGMHLVLSLPRRVDDTALSRDLARVGVSAAPLSECYLRRAKASGLILGYGNADPEHIRAGMKQLAAVLRRGHGTVGGT